MTKTKAPDRGDSVNCAWRTSSPSSSSSSTCCSQRWRRSWPTRPSLKSWRSWRTPSCLSPTKRWTRFHDQVCMDHLTGLRLLPHDPWWAFPRVQESLCIPATLSCWAAVTTTTMTSPLWWSQAGLRRSTVWWRRSPMSGLSPVKERLAFKEPPLVVVRTVCYIFWWTETSSRGPRPVWSPK